MLAAHWDASRQRLQWVLQVSTRGQTGAGDACCLEGTLPTRSHDFWLSCFSQGLPGPLHVKGGQMAFYHQPDLPDQMAHVYLRGSLWFSELMAHGHWDQEPLELGLACDTLLRPPAGRECKRIQTRGCVNTK